MLFAGLSDPDSIALATEQCAQFNLQLESLPKKPPSKESDLTAILLGAEIAFLSLDGPGHSLSWLKCLTRGNLQIPIIALFSKENYQANFMEPLFKASSFGLDGVLPLPLNAQDLHAQLLRFFGPLRPQAPKEPKSQDSVAPEPANFTSSFIANCSPQNQALLKVLADNQNAPAFCLTGPPGCELALLLKEIAAQTKRTVELIDLTGPTPANVPSVENIEPNSKCCVYLSPLGMPPPDHLNKLPRLVVEPLQFRPADVAEYVATWLPKLYRACRPEGAPMRLPSGIDVGLLSYSWPGEFAELWRCLQRVALTSSSDPLPAPLKGPSGTESWEEIAQASARAAFERKQRGELSAHKQPASHLVQI